MLKSLRMLLTKSSRLPVSPTLKRSSQLSSRPKNKTTVFRTMLTCSTQSSISLRKVIKKSRIKSRRSSREDNSLTWANLTSRSLCKMSAKCCSQRYLTTRMIRRIPRRHSKKSSRTLLWWWKCSRDPNSSYVSLRKWTTMMESILPRTTSCSTWLSSRSTFLRWSPILLSNVMSQMHQSVQFLWKNFRTKISQRSSGM